MPGLILHVGATMQCMHQGPASTTPTQTRVLVSGQQVATSSNQITVAGCPFTVSNPKPQPCVTVKWSMVASRVFAAGQPVLVQPSPGAGQGVCLSAEQAPQGTPAVTQIQLRVRAT
jgi:hypothetical protein